MIIVIIEKYDTDNDGTYDKEVSNEYINGQIVKKIEGSSVFNYIYDSNHRLKEYSNYSYDENSNVIKIVDKYTDIFIEYSWKEF